LEEKESEIEQIQAKITNLEREVATQTLFKIQKALKCYNYNDEITSLQKKLEEKNTEMVLMVSGYLYS
jgi:predicted RNase H-like nuclease (RuvC/YqgF family)